MVDNKFYKSNLDKLSVPYRESVQKETTVVAHAPVKSSRRGWRGLDPVTTIEGHGIPNKMAIIAVVVLLLFFLMTRIDPNSTSIFMRNEYANYALKFCIGTVCLLTLYLTFIKRNKIVIAKAGFYHQFLWRKGLVPWSHCSEFRVIERKIDNNSFLIPDRVEKYVHYKVEGQRIGYELSFPNMSAHVLCSLMNQYRDKYLKQD